MKFLSDTLEKQDSWTAVTPPMEGMPSGKRLCAALLLFSVMSLTGCVAEDPGQHRIVPKEDRARDSPSPQRAGELDPVEFGSVLFRGKGVCSACHGPEGKGTQIAPDLTDEEWLHIDDPVTPEKIVAVIENGVSNPVRYPGAMPPRGGGSLTDDEVEAVAAYVMTLHHSPL